MLGCKLGAKRGWLCHWTLLHAGRSAVGDPVLKGGDWDTGYREWDGEFFIFAGVETAGRTGHDYANHWVGEHLSWQAKGGTRLANPQIQKLIGGQVPIHLFTRSDNQAAFTYRGLGRVLEVRDTSPVEVLWAFDALVPAVGVSYVAGGGHEADQKDPATETEASRAQRLGQGKFRQDLMDRWDRRCALTGLPLPELLRASHIKPWRDCTAKERHDCDNGLLLALHVDGLFDRGLVSFEDDGRLMLGSRLEPAVLANLGLSPSLRIDQLTDGSRAYLAIHRNEYFDLAAKPEAKAG